MMARILPDLLLCAGCGLITRALAYWSVPAAWLFAGAVCLIVALAATEHAQ